MAVLTEGYADHRGHRIWYGVSGHDDSTIPLLTVHGGPGLPHDYLEPLVDLSARRRVVFYDQYGCGKSDRAVDAVEYDVDLFVDEIDTIRSALGLDQVHLFAHSYGGPLVLQYLLSRSRDGVRSLTLSNSFASIPALADGWARRRRQLSPAAQAALAAADDGIEDGEAYGAALGEFISRFVLPFAPPEALVRTQQGSGGEVYARMHGSSWFVPDGAWKDFDVTDRLHELRMPTLIIAGRDDQCVPDLSRAMHGQIAGSRLVVLDTAHLPFFESPGEYLRLIDEFLGALG
jgi:proline-specific peptidase